MIHTSFFVSDPYSIHMVTSEVISGIYITKKINRKETISFIIKLYPESWPLKKSP